MKKIFYIPLLISLSAQLSAQSDSSFRLIKTFPLTAKEFVLDNLDNLYIITVGDQLKKYNASGDSVAVYNEMKRYGKLYAIDVSNPLKLLLFYKDFSTISVLDPQLAPRSTLDLRRHNISQASAIGLSYDNNIWVFDAIDNKLKKIDEQGHLLLETVDFRTVFSESFVPEKIIDQNNSVYLYDPAAGVFEFDHYGSFQKKHIVKNWRSITINDQNIMGINNNRITILNTANLMQKQYQFPSSFGSFQQYIIGNTRLFTLSKDSINVYSFRF